MARAISLTLSSVVGSSITTVAGFVALCFMSFKLGLDMGLVMAKGVVLGVIGCVTILPSMILLLDKPLQRTRHRPLIPDMHALARGVTKVFPVFLVLNTIYNLLLKAYQLQKKTMLVNAVSVAEPLIMALFAVTMIGSLGSDAVWLAFPFGEVVCLLIIAVSVMIYAGKLTLALADWMKLSPDFGASAEECMAFSVHSMEEVINISVRVIAFCRKRRIDERRSMLAGLCVEEMVGNVVEHGFRPGEKHQVDVRLTAKDRLIICMRDDCEAFDPKSRLDQFDPEDVTKNIGIRMIAAMSEEMNYQCTAGINTLLIRV